MTKDACKEKIKVAWEGYMHGAAPWRVGHLKANLAEVQLSLCDWVRKTSLKLGQSIKQARKDLYAIEYEGNNGKAYAKVQKRLVICWRRRMSSRRLDLSLLGSGIVIVTPGISIIMLHTGIRRIMSKPLMMIIE